MLYGQAAVMRKWSESDSRLLLKLGRVAQEVQEVVPLAASAFHSYALLLCTDRLVLAKLRGGGFSRHSTQLDLAGKSSTRTLGGGDCGAVAFSLGGSKSHQLDRSFEELLQPLDQLKRRRSLLRTSLYWCRTESNLSGTTEIARGLLFEDLQEGKLSGAFTTVWCLFSRQMMS